MLASLENQMQIGAPETRRALEARISTVNVKIQHLAQNNSQFGSHNLSSPFAKKKKVAG